MPFVLDCVPLLQSREESMEALKHGSDILFILLGAIMVLAMHAGFAFLELGTVRKKNQVNALMKILVDFAVSTDRLFLHRLLRSPTARTSSPAPSSWRRRAATSCAVLLPADVRRRDSGDRVGRHRRAREVQPAARRDVPAGRLPVSVLRGHRVERRATASRRG